MEVTELTLWIARLGVLVLMYVFVLALIFALLADARAASTPRAGRALPAEPVSPPAAPAPAVPILAVIGGTPPSGGSEYRLTAPLEIGRDAACDITIPSHFISKRHARISRSGEQWMLEDLGSTNGSTLNGQPLTIPRPLNRGDKFTVGDTEFTVR